MSLIIDKIINLTNSTYNTSPKAVDQLSIIHEAANGELVQYYINKQTHAEGDKNTFATSTGIKDEDGQIDHYEYVEYDTIKWSSAASRITRQAIDSLGLKAFPNIGSIAFYKLAYRNISVILAPVNNRENRSPAPKFTYVISEDNKSITITLYDPTDAYTIKYMAYRVNFVYGPHTLEYITYEKTVTITNFPVTGRYVLYCSGYVSDGEGSSEISAEALVDLIGLYDEWPSITPGAGDKYLIGLDFNDQNFAIATMSNGQEIISEHPAQTGGSGGGNSSVYTGTTPPASNFGSDGNLYIQYELTEVDSETIPVFTAMFVKVASIWMPIDSVDSGAIYNIIPAVLSGMADPDASSMYDGQQYLQYGNTAESLYIPLNSWFDTGYIIGNNSKIILKCKVPEPSAANTFATPIGSRRATNTQAFWFGMRRSGATDIVIGHGGSEASPFTATPYYDKDIQITYDNAAFEITNGTDTDRHAYSSYDYSNNNYSLYIGTLNENNSDYGSVCHCALYLYALEVYESDVLVRNFIPYSSNNVACLKDTVTDTVINIVGDPATYYPSIEKIIASWYKLNGTAQPMQVSEQYSPTINITEGSQGITMWRIKYYTHDGETYLGREYVEDEDNGEWIPTGYHAYAFATVPNGEPVDNAQNNITENTNLYVIELDSFALLKQDMSETTYVRLSNAVGDGATFSGRYFTRTTDEPVIFITKYSSGWRSYGVLSLSNTKPAETHSGYGDLVLAGTNTINDTVVYLYVMSGQWSSGTPTYTVDEESVTLENDIITSSNNVWSFMAYEDELTEFIKRYIVLSEQ